MPKWIDNQYNSEVLDLGIVKVLVYWESVAKDEPTGYRYRYGDFKSTTLYSSMDQAKQAAIKSAHKRLLNALETLGNLE